MFHRPAILLLLLLVPLIAWAMWANRHRESITFSSTLPMESLGPTLRQRLSWLPPVLMLGTIALLIVCLAGPREGRQQTVSDTEGIAIQLVVDRSGSMQAMDSQ